MKTVTRTAILRAGFVRDEEPIEVTRISQEDFIKKFGWDPLARTNENGEIIEPNAAKTTHNLVIVYLKSDDKSFSLTIQDYKTDITDREVTSGAKAILVENVFTPGGTDLVKVDHAYRVDQTKTDVVID